MIAFERANPRFGEVGFNNKQFQVDQTGDKVRAMKKAPEWITLPGCLESLLKDVLLKKAKTDTLAKLKKVILADPACQAVLKEHRAYFKEEFWRALGRRQRGGQERDLDARDHDGGLQGP